MSFSARKILRKIQKEMFHEPMQENYDYVWCTRSFSDCNNYKHGSFFRIQLELTRDKVS